LQKQIVGMKADVDNNHIFDGHERFPSLFFSRFSIL